MTGPTIGDTHSYETVVSADMAPPHLPVVVLSTPSMVMLMEMASLRAVEEAVGPGMTTVGTHVDIAHRAAALEGQTLVVNSTVTEVDGRRIVFEVKVTSEGKTIGEGRHERFVVPDRFGD